MSNASFEKQLLQSDLFAELARADGKILDAETLVASGFIGGENSPFVELMKSNFENKIHDDDFKLDFDEIKEFMARISTEEKKKILRSLSALAICDGELHENEQKLIEQFTQAMQVDLAS